VSADLLDEWVGCGRLDRPPRSACYIRFPAEFGRRFTIFVDTEEEFDWRAPLSRDERGTSAMKAMPSMHARMRAAGAKPVYLIDHPIVSDPAAVDMLRGWLEAGECSVGAQLHPWVNPPFEEDVNGFNSFTGNLPVRLQREKLQILTETIEAAFGRRPTVYRAGRYGVGTATAALLEEAGYQVDTSVRALFSYANEGGPDFEQVWPQPYWVGDCALLEVPLSAAFTGRLWRRGRQIFRKTAGMPRVRGALARAAVLQRVALSPEDMPIDHAIEAATNLLDEGAQLLTISFHSPSVEPGHTPYVRTREDLEAFHAWWDRMFEFLARLHVEPASIEEVVAAADGTRSRDDGAGSGA